MNMPHGIRRGLLERETGIEPVRDFLKKGIYLRNLGLFCEQIGLFRCPCCLLSQISRHRRGKIKDKFFSVFWSFR